MAPQNDFYGFSNWQGSSDFLLPITCTPPPTVSQNGHPVNIKVTPGTIEIGVNSIDGVGGNISKTYNCGINCTKTSGSVRTSSGNSSFSGASRSGGKWSP